LDKLFRLDGVHNLPRHAAPAAPHFRTAFGSLPQLQHVTVTAVVV
jgi:hypothetical protein